VLLGFLDGRGRAYDLTFRTLKRRLRDESGAWDLEPGEALAGGVPLEAALFLESPRPRLLLRPTTGSAAASARRLVFVAGEGVLRTTEEPTAFNVAVHVPPTAVDHLFRGSGGREVLEVRREDIRRAVASRADLALDLEATWVGGGKEPARFRLVLRPRPAAEEAVEPLGL
jgi:hypothetical protein